MSVDTVPLTLAPVGGGIRNGAAPAARRVPLLEPASVRPATRRAVRFFSGFLLVALAGYATFDHAFAWIHIPGTPIYPGEAGLLVGFGMAVFATGYIRLIARAGWPVALLGGFILWGLARTLPYVKQYGIDALRDASLWYYALFALLVVAVLAANGGRLQRWARLFARLAPLLVIWGIAGVLLGEHRVGPSIPGSTVAVLSHKIGNVAVTTAIAVAFLWLVPTGVWGSRVRTALTVIGLCVIGMAGTQNRGGMVAAAVGLGLVILMTRAPMRLLNISLATVVAAVLVAGGFGLAVGAGKAQRTVSVDQLVQNVASLTQGGSSTNQLSGNVAFRTELWSGVIALVDQNHAQVVGLGFGRNLAAELGLQGTNPNDPLRSPHNSHVDVIARMGAVGAVLWFSLWGVWLAAVLIARKRFQQRGQRIHQGMAELAIVGVVVIMVNAFFDPTLESPPVAIWLWTLFGIGAALFAMVRRSRPIPSSSD